MTRRTMLSLTLAPVLFAQDTPQPDPDDAAALKVLTDVAASLSAGDALEALRSFDPTMKGYPRLEAYLTALTGQFFVSSSVDFLSRKREGNKEVLTADWFVQLRSRGDDGPLLRRREQVNVTIDRTGKKPKITALAPLDLFAPVV